MAAVIVATASALSAAVGAAFGGSIRTALDARQARRSHAVVDVVLDVLPPPAPSFAVIAIAIPSTLVLLLMMRFAAGQPKPCSQSTADDEEHASEEMEHAAALAAAELAQRAQIAAAQALQKERDEQAQKVWEQDVERRRLLKNDQELKGAVIVLARVRPFLPFEKEQPQAGESCPDATIKSSHSLERNSWLRVSPSGFGIDVLARNSDKNALKQSCAPDIKVAHTFEFDRVFDSSNGNEEVFKEVSGLVLSSVDGFNCCIFAYGQTVIKLSVYEQ
jgi:hypothetical protein